MLKIDEQALSLSDSMIKIIQGNPTLKIMWENMSTADQTLMKKSMASTVKQSMQKFKGDQVDITPDVKVVISYPENIYMTEPYLKLDHGLVKCYIFRYDVDFEQQVRNLAMLRNINIIELKTEKVKAIESSNTATSESNNSTNANSIDNRGIEQNDGDRVSTENSDILPETTEPANKETPELGL